MGKERMKMQENMNPAPEGAQTPADEEAAREAARLSQLKADMLVSLTSKPKHTQLLSYIFSER